MKHQIFLFLVIVFCFFSCKKKVEIERPEFFGTWFGHNTDTYYQIKIDNNSNAVYSEYSLYDGTTHYRKGKARANNSGLKIGTFIRFKINEYPHKIDTSNSQIYVPDPDMFSLSNKKATWKMGLTNFGIFYRKDY